MGDSIEQKWARVRKRFLDGYTTAADREDYCNTFAYVNGLKLATIQRWRLMIDSSKSLQGGIHG